jgi:hypothetical protein
MIEIVITALQKIQKIYLEYPTIANKHKHGERVFAYEFYHQLRERIEPLFLDLSGEPIKGQDLLPAIDQPIVPDFIIHNYATETNEMAIEVKLTPKLTGQQILNDLEKLVILINPPLRYNWGVFYAGNCNLIDKINNSRLKREEILQILNNYPNIIMLNTLRLPNQVNRRECINEQDIIRITRANFR